MKNIIITIICLIPFNIYAETFYTDYILISENNTEYKEEYVKDELKKIEKKIGYNNYEEIIINNGYYEKDKAPSYLTISSPLETITKTKYAKVPFNSNDYEYSTLKIRNYQSARYIVLRSFTTDAILKSIKCYYNKEIVSHKIYQSNYDFISKLNSRSNIVIDLGKKYNLDKLSIDLTFEENNLNEIRFMLDIYDTNYYSSINPKLYYLNTFYRYNKIENFTINFIFADDFQKLLTNLYWVNNNFYDSLNSINYYQKTVTLYKYYKLGKKYLNIYTEIPLENYKHDYNDKKEIYDYYERDFIEIKDEINSIDEINDIIISTSIPKEKIDLEFKNINEEEILLIIKTKNCKFFKKIKLLPKKINDAPENTEELKNQTNKQYNNATAANINLDNQKEGFDIVEDIYKEDNFLINSDYIINDISDEESTFENTNEIIIEKDFYPINVIESIEKTKVLADNIESLNTNIENSVNDYKKLLASNSSKQIEKTDKLKINYKIYILILLICVKFFTLFRKNKSSFVEEV